MIIASIDIQNGKVVQLKQGAELMLEREDPLALAEDFDHYGEVAVIDLDAAMNKGANRDLIKPLLRRAECRVGGGIRTPEQARELVSLGARKIIIGSAAFRDPAGGFRLNRELLEAFAKKIGRERLILAVDARNNEIVVDGWKTPTGLPLIETAKAAESLVSEFLFTCVEREGTLGGIDLEPVQQLRKAVTSTLTVAGGITTLEEIETLAALGCDIQLGMALYTGKINLADAFIRSLNWQKSMRGEVRSKLRCESPPTPASSGPKAPAGSSASPLCGGKTRERFARSDVAAQGCAAVLRRRAGSPMQDAEGCRQCPPATPPLLPVIAQSGDGQVLMTGFADQEAVAETFKRGNLCFHSRTRNKLWMKGEHSGNTLTLIRLRADCDRDALLAEVEPAGPVCHTGAWSCFGTNRRYTWEYLQQVIADRFKNPVPGSYTATLDDELVREKVMEEADEVCTAKTHDEIVWEAADLLYFTTALITRAGINVTEVLDELDRRHKK